MTRYLTVALLIASLGLTACTRPDRFGGGNDGAGGSGIGTTGLGDVNDPSSPAYFAQAIGDRVLFQVDQSTLSSQAMQVLDGQAQWLMTNSDYLAIIEGHADEQGTREYNLALGARRANAVREYLISRGVPASRLQTISYGKERPIAVCSDEACYSQNRRAVTVISVASLG
jgi:peptidoglycan-associated lipoprotein